MVDLFGTKRLRTEVAGLRAEIAEEQRRRLAAERVARRSSRNYTAALASRLSSGWSTSPVAPDQFLRSDLRSLRARAREQYRNNDYARRFVGMVRANVVGDPGIRMQSRIVDPDGKTDFLANRAVEDRWSDWCRAEHCDVEARNNWLGLQTLFVNTAAIDGEVLILKSYTNPRHGLSLRFADPEIIDTQYNDVLPSGNVVRLGVEFDGSGRRAAYYLTSGAPSPSTYDSLSLRRIRVPADQVIHAFVPEYVGQVRGVPWMASALGPLRMLEGYLDAALVAARVGAAKMGFYSTEDGPGYDGTGEDPSSGELLEDVEPGTFGKLPAGTTLSSWSPEYPKGEMPEFVKLALRRIASGFGVSYNILANDLEGVNYSSIRAGILDEREMWKALQNWMVREFCQPVYESWLRTQLQLGTLTVPTSTGLPKPLNPDKEDKYRSVFWSCRRWPWVDPLNDMQAAEKTVQMGAGTVSEIIRDRGLEPEEVWRERSSEKEMMKNLGAEAPPADARSGVSNA